MKHILPCLASLAFLTTAIHAQTPTPSPEPALSPGKYLLITTEKRNISLRDCEVSADKDGTTIKFPVPVKYPEAALKPIPLIYLIGGTMQFSIGPSDQADPQITKKMGGGISVYIGSFSSGELRGTLTAADASDDPHTGNFVLHKL